MEKRDPKRHRDLLNTVIQLQGFPFALSQNFEPSYSPRMAPSLDQGSGPESISAPGLICHCPMGFQARSY